MPTSANLTISAEGRETDTLAYLLNHADRELSISTAFRTLIFAPKSTAEMRRARRSKPVRTITFDLTADGRDESLALDMFLGRLGTQRQLIPLFRDIKYLTAGAAASASSVSVDTTLASYGAGVQCVVFKRPQAGVYATFAVVTIDSVTDTSLTFTGTLGQAFDAGDAICPLMTCEVTPQLPDVSVSQLAENASARLVCEEISGASALPAASAPGVTPTGFDTYDDGNGALPMLDIDSFREKDARTGYQRYGSLVNSGQSQLPDLEGDRPSKSFTIGVAGLDREESWSIVRFFDSRAGRCYPFWLVGALTPYTLTGVNSTTELDFAAVGELDDWAYRPVLYLSLDDGTLYIRGVSAVSRNDAGTTDTVTLDAPLPSAPALSSVSEAGQAWKARFDADDRQGTWTRTSNLQSVYEIVELPVEKDVTIADLTVIETAPCGESTDCSDAIVIGDDTTGRLYFSSTARIENMELYPEPALGFFKSGIQVLNQAGVGGVVKVSDMVVTFVLFRVTVDEDECDTPHPLGGSASGSNGQTLSIEIVSPTELRIAGLFSTTVASVDVSSFNNDIDVVAPLGGSGEYYIKGNIVDNPCSSQNTWPAG